MASAIFEELGARPRPATSLAFFGTRARLRFLELELESDRDCCCFCIVLFHDYLRLQSTEKPVVLIDFVASRLAKYWKTRGFTMFLHKCFETLLVLLRVRSNNLKNKWFYYVFACKGWKTSGFTVCLPKTNEKPMVLLCCRPKRLRNPWFYCVFAQNW